MLKKFICLAAFSLLLVVSGQRYVHSHSWDAGTFDCRFEVFEQASLSGVNTEIGLGSPGVAALNIGASFEYVVFYFQHK